MKRLFSILLVLSVILCSLPTTVFAVDTDHATSGDEPIDTAKWQGTTVVWQKIPDVNSYSLDISSRVTDGLHSAVIESEIHIKLEGTKVTVTVLSGKYINVTYDKDTQYFTADVGSAMDIYPDDVYYFSLTGFVGSSGAYHESSDEIKGSILLAGGSLHTVSFLPNGGTGSIEPIKKYTNSMMLLPECSFTPPAHCEFEGWKSSENGNVYQAKSSYTVKGDTVFTAQWKQKTWIAYANCLLDAPVAGQTPDMTPIAALPDSYNAILDRWYLWESPYPELSSTDKFVAGKKYAVRVKFTAKSGYYFDTDTEYLVNGDRARFLGGNEYEYVFTASEASEESYTLSGIITSYLDENEEITVRLRKSGSWAYTYSATFTGNQAAYSMSNIKSGVYIYSVVKKNHVLRSGSITINGDKSLDVKICPIGDADNNGRVNSADAKAAFRHVNEQAVIEDTYRFYCADVAKPEGIINSADAKAIFQHANNQKSLWTE